MKAQVPAGGTVVYVLSGNGLKDPGIALKQKAPGFHQGILQT
jgi:hypothetical protein